MKAYIEKNKLTVIKITLYSMFLLCSVLPAGSTEALEVDYNDIVLDTAYDFNNPLYEPYSSIFISTVTGSNMGDLTSSVFYSYIMDTFLYKLVVDPGIYIQDISFFNTVFRVEGFNPSTHRYGYSARDAEKATGVADAFFISYSPINGQLKFEIDSPQANWAGPDYDALPITFFFESSYAPGKSTYGLLASEPGITENFGPVTTPVPEPGTIMLLLTGLGCITGMRFREILNPRNKSN